MKLTRSPSYLVTAFLAVLGLGGCEQPLPRGPASAVPQAGETAEPIMIDTDAASYPLGGRVSIRVVNRTGRPVRFNPCTSRLETLGDDNVWRVVRESLGEDCNSAVLTLAPGQAAFHTFTAGPTLPAGRYRIRAPLTDFDGVTRQEVRSGTFTLISRDSSG